MKLKRAKYSHFYALRSFFLFAKLYTCKLLIRIKITLDCQINRENLILWWDGGCGGWKKIDKLTSGGTFKFNPCEITNIFKLPMLVTAKKPLRFSFLKYVIVKIHNGLLNFILN